MDEMVLYIYGNVQGVGFRNFAQKVAEEFRLTGLARNCAAGSLEIIVQGSIDKLIQFEEKIKRGPRGSCIERVLSDWRPVVETFLGFLVQ